MFRITHELINAMRDDDDPVAQKTAEETVYMLDQCHNIEPKVPAIIRSVQTLQELFAKALLVDREALARRAGARATCCEANNLLWSAFFTDVRGPLAELRQERGLPADPFHAYLDSGEDEQRAADRVGGEAAELVALTGCRAPPPQRPDGTALRAGIRYRIRAFVDTRGRGLIRYGP